MILNMNQLRAFHSAARLQSVSLAAQELMVTPPAISMQIKQLEETLEIRLMFRHRNSIRLTEVGEKVFQRASTIFEQIRDMENYLDDISTAKSGELRIGCPQTPAKYIMPRLINRFNETYPGIRIILNQGSTSQMVENLLNLRDELAFLRYHPEEKRIKVKVIADREVVLVAASDSGHIPTDEVSVAQLNDIPSIVPMEGSGMRDVIFEYFNLFKVVPNVVMESGSIDLIKELIRKDTGISFLEKYAVEEELQSGTFKVVSILEGSPSIQFGIGYLNRKSLSPAAWAFLRMLAKLENLQLV
jgi:DNA-binding transcriptional LysR family regulator